MSFGNKSYKRYLKQNDRGFAIIHRTQDIIDADELFEDGIFRRGNQYSKMFMFTDINYSICSDQQQLDIIERLCEFVDALDYEIQLKYTINNRKIDLEHFKESVLFKMKNDSFDRIREEYNNFILEKMQDNDNYIQEKYITLSIEEKNIKNARRTFNRLFLEIQDIFSTIGSVCSELNAQERMKIFHDFFRGNNEEFKCDFKKEKLKGHEFKDFICPKDAKFYKDYFTFGNKYGRALYVNKYPESKVKNNVISSICDLNKSMMLSIDFFFVPSDEAMTILNNKNVSTETNKQQFITKAQQRSKMTVMDATPQIEREIIQVKSFLETYMDSDEKMILLDLNIVHAADSLEELEADSETIIESGKRSWFEFDKLLWATRQLDGLQTALPFGWDRVNVRRTALTSGACAFVPFNTQNLMDDNGIWYGINAVSQKPILLNVDNLLNQNCWVFGVPGSGKSFFMKTNIEVNALIYGEKDDILIIDPEGEYNHVVKKYGGSVIEISSQTKNYVNIMDLEEGYGESDSIRDKSNFILTFFDEITQNEGGLSSSERSVLDRCVIQLYQNCKRMRKTNPTLVDLMDILSNQNDKLAVELARKLEIYAKGSLDLFAHETNVDVSNNFISYNISNIGEQLKSVGYLVMLDAILNRVNRNWKKGIKTHLFIDESHVLLSHDNTLNFFTSAWRQFRKRNCYSTASTQNVSYLLAGDVGKNMVDNTELIIMFNQGTNDIVELANLLKITEEQYRFIRNVKSGHGLIKYQNMLLPFVNVLNKDMEMYRDNTTKPGEMIFEGK